MSRRIAALAFTIASTLALLAPAQAQQTDSTAKLGPSGLPLPRFVSLKSGKVNLRIGPGLNYGIDWMYTRAGVPMEITQEFDNWRRVRDSDGTEGWINQSLLSGRRTAIVAPWQKGKDMQVELRAKAEAEARPVAHLEPGAIGTIRECDGQWCQMEFEGHRGFVQQAQVWGAYPGESVKD